ncbi:MAG: type IV pilus twitching motility protein PilT [Candidatus Sumerlaeia bacterium]|nr:type IV pilus twitching motility protein PilT [Candidatus Sumerlaeia bacterium]
MSVQKLVERAVEQNASDLHLRAGEVPRLRIDGELAAVEHAQVSETDMRDFLYAMLTKEQIEKFERTHELDYSFTVEDLCRLRINLFVQRGQFCASLRVIPNHIPSMEEIYLPPACYEFVKCHKGLVLVTGPTGSGKSTSLAAMLDHINATRHCHILTIEDPIEFVYTNKLATVSQREVSQDTGSFAAALRHSFRQDPDVVMIGEMRDLETMQAAITLAETGHLTFSTLHTGEASQTIHRIIDSFPPHQQTQVRMQLAMSLEGIISQTLVPLRGQKGRIAAREVLVCTRGVKNLIREGKIPQIASAMQTGAEEGMITMDAALTDYVQKGLITYDVALAASFDKRAFAERFGRRGGSV